MKHLAVSLPDDVYIAAKVAAAERGMSLSAMVRDLLLEKIGTTSEFTRRKALQNDVFSAISSFRGGDRLSRDELYGR